MECLPQDCFLKFHPDTLEVVRKELNLDTPGRIVEALDILEKWVQKQPHFVKKDFSREYLERSLIAAKGLVERAKERIDKLCTFKTLMPEFFAIDDIREEFEHLHELLLIAHLPQLTPQQNRVFMCKLLADELIDSAVVFSFYKYLIVLSEYFKRYEYCTGFHLVLDYTDVNILSFVTKISPMELRQIMTLMTEGYGLRIKGIHVISSSKMVDTLLSLLKQVFSAKLSSRIHLHKTPDTLTDFIPRDMMPSDYGGTEKSLLELNKNWLDVLSSKDFVEYMKIMTKANTNEAFRQSDKFNEHYIGMPGSFRALSVD